MLHPIQICSNYTNRKSRIEGVDSVVHFGLQHYLTRLQRESEQFFALTPTEVSTLCVEYADRLGSDFAVPDEDGHIASGEAMLNYVAVTRAEQVLDLGGLAG